MLELSIIIPTYNEETKINNTLRTIHNYLEKEAIVDYEVIVCDDGSLDSTVSIVKKYKQNWENLILVENIHRGKAATVLSGLAKGQGKYLLFSDADLSASIEELPKMINPLKNSTAQITIASREAKGSIRIDEPQIRHIMGRVFNIMVQILLLRGIKDTQCGLKGFKRDVFHDILKRLYVYKDQNLEIVYPKVSAFDIEILFIAKGLGYTIEEIPVKWTYFGDSKVHNIKDSYYNAVDVLKIWWANLKGAYNFETK